MSRIFFASFLFCATLSAASQILHLGNGGEPRDLDPQLNTGNPEYHILSNLFEPLVSKDPKDLHPIPGVAESWKISKDGLTYTFSLRKNAQWTNGAAVTAEDFIYSWLRLIHPDTAAEYSNFGFYIKNGRAFNRGELKDPKEVGLKALDAYHLEVKLEKPTPFFLKLLCSQPMLPVHKPTVEKFGTKWTRPENMVSNGPFKLSDWVIHKIITLKKNPNYWDAEKVKVQEVHFYPIDKPETEEKMFRSGTLHLVTDIPIDRLPFWELDQSKSFHKNPYLGVYFYWFNHKRPPMDNLLVRKALTYGIDREKLTAKVTLAKQLAATFFTPPGTGNYQPPSRLPKNGSGIPQAKLWLKQAGFPEGKGLPPIELVYNTSINHKKIAEAIQQMWKENLGVVSTLVNQEWKVLLETQQTKNFSLLRAGWTADYNDPSSFLDTLLSDSGNNHSNWTSPKYDAFVHSATHELDLKKRNRLFAQAEEILLEELPVLPIYIYTRLCLLSPKVQGWYDNLEDFHPLKGVRLSD